MRIDVSAIGRADATDGFGRGSSIVRVCARLAGTSGRDATATKADLVCPPNAPTQVPSVGEVGTTVPLEP